MSRNWQTVPEKDLDNGTATEWRLMIVDGIFYWIDRMSDDTYNVIGLMDILC